MEEIKELIQNYKEDLKIGNDVLATHWVIKDLENILHYKKRLNNNKISNN